MSGTYEMEESEAFNETSFAEGVGDSTLTFGGPATSTDPLGLPGASMAVDSPVQTDEEDVEESSVAPARVSRQDEMRQEIVLEA